MASEALAAGQALGDGNTTDKGLSQLQACAASLLELSPADYGENKAKSRLSSITDVCQLLDPMENPTAYRIIQDVAVEKGVITPLLGLAQRGPTDQIRSKSAEALARLAFGNESGVAAIATHPDFLSTVQQGLQRSQVAEQLSVLQLTQAVAARPPAEIGEVLKAVVTMVTPSMMSSSFEAVSQAVLDTLVSCSFSCPDAVVSAVSLPTIASLLSEGPDHPGWLPSEPLFVFICGLLATNVLSVPIETPEAEAARAQILNRLSEGPFLGYFLQATDAAVERREWPADTAAYHSPARVALCAQQLADYGFRRCLLPTVGPFAKVIELSPDVSTTRLALKTLRNLCRDSVCIEAVLALEQFRSETLEMLHKSGDEPDATELLSYLTTVENMIQGAQAALDTSKSYCTLAPTVSQLADIFARFAPLDGELTFEQLPGPLSAVPIGPLAAALASMSGAGKSQKFSLQSFGEHIYGTPMILGWWPSLMEQAAIERQALGEVPRLPDLAGLVALFERGAGGANKVCGNALLEVVLPAAGLPASGDVVDASFIELGFNPELQFPAFAQWFSKVCVDLAAAEAAAAAAAAAGEAA
mmetsp:Transcript_42242/g.74068  ORF Transcript_42242/g.74068 Transcript_42242/m.74068 type:complete len:587 (+) Transcript_42242:70-1830(+)